MNTPDLPARAEARLPLGNDLAARYMLQLCKHFEHRRPVTYTDTDGSIGFESGTCTLHAGDGTLTLSLAAPDEPARERLQDVVARHLLRFAFRDPPDIAWTTLD